MVTMITNYHPYHTMYRAVINPKYFSRYLYSI